MRATTPLAAGGKPTAAEINAALNDGAQGVLGRWRRTTSSTATTTVVGVIRVDNIAVTANRAYTVRTGGLVPSSSVVNDDVEIHVRFKTGGTAAATTDAVLPGSALRGRYGGGTNGLIAGINALYVPAATTTLSILLCVSRSGGTGSVSIFSDTGAYPIDLWLEDAAVAPALAGVNI